MRLIKMNPTKVARLAKAIQNFEGYNTEKKKEFKSASMAFLRELVKEMGLVVKNYDLRWNEGGIAVSGEATLHHEKFYIQISATIWTVDNAILWRECKGRKDYSGGYNRFASCRSASEPTLIQMIHFCSNWANGLDEFGELIK